MRTADCVSESFQVKTDFEAGLFVSTPFRMIRTECLGKERSDSETHERWQSVPNVVEESLQWLEP